jgi:hypothetical protein
VNLLKRFYFQFTDIFAGQIIYICISPQTSMGCYFVWRSVNFFPVGIDIYVLHCFTVVIHLSFNLFLLNHYYLLFDSE